MVAKDVALEAHLFAQLQRCGGGASYRQLLEWGAHKWTISRMCESGTLMRVGRGFFTLPWSGSPGDSWQRQRSEHLRTVAAFTRPGTIAGLRSAGLVWGLSVDAIPERPEVLRPPGSGYLRGARSIRRVVPESHVTTIRGVVVTTLERTAVYIALDLPAPRALISIDAILRRGASREVMRSILEQLGSLRGCRLARRAIDWADGHAESALESRGRGELLIRGAARPLCNVSFRLGEVEFRVDKWWPKIPSSVRQTARSNTPAR
jgi:hypothetical protein